MNESHWSILLNMGPEDTEKQQSDSSLLHVPDRFTY